MVRDYPIILKKSNFTCHPSIFFFFPFEVDHLSILHVMVLQYKVDMFDQN